jgi:cardiolipin synthase A/B
MSFDPRNQDLSCQPQMLLTVDKFVEHTLQSIESASLRILVEMYGWRESGSGLEIAEALIAAANRGVFVGVIADSNGSRQYPAFRGSKALFRRMADAGIHINFNRYFWPYIRKTDGKRILRIDRSGFDHRKYFSFDGKLAILGGRNLSAGFDTWNDVMVSFQGPSVGHGDRLFAEHWRHLQGCALPQTAYSDFTLGGGDTEILANDPASGHFGATNGWFEDLNSARSTFWVQSPFLTSRPMVKALAQAAQRNIDIRVLIPSLRFHPSALLRISRSHAAVLVSVGAKVYESETFTHSKVWKSDNTVTVSSLNIGERSRRKDRELSLRITNPQVVATVNEYLLDCMESAGKSVAVPLLPKLVPRIFSVGLVRISI